MIQVNPIDRTEARVEGNYINNIHANKYWLCHVLHKPVPVAARSKA